MPERPAGNGGAGGNGANPNGGGGGGGAAGWGVVVNGSGLTYTMTGTAQGGTGGAGGTGGPGTASGGGNGGSGGIGVAFTAGGTLVNSGSIVGGAGGAGGTGPFQSGANGAGGAGVVGSGLTVVNSGTISGGSAGGGGVQANAITFTGGANTLTLQAGTLTGNIGVQAGTVTFNQSTAQILNNVITGAGSVIQNGTGTLTLGGANTYSGGTTINGGAISVSADTNLGAAGGGVAFGGGTLQYGAGFSSARAMTLNSGGGTFDTNGNTATLSGVIGGTAGLTKTGAGTLTLTGTNSYGGGTIIQAGTLNIGTTSTMGSITGAITNAGSLTFVNANTSGITAITNTAPGAQTSFTNGSSAGTMTIANNNGSTTLFQDNSTAANATIVSGSGLDPGFFGGVGFAGNSTAGNATIINNKGGAGIFFDNSTAGNATIVSNGGPGGFGGLSTLDAAVDFEGSSTAGNATITANGNSLIVFGGSASGGNARFITNAGASFDLSFLTSAGTTAGSIEGAGRYNLGSKQLTVGSNNLSTTVSGVIADGGLNGGTGASLVKVGGGTLTLTGNNLYTGGTTISGGLINFSTAGNFGTGQVTLNGGGLQWATGTSTDISPRLAPLGAGGGIFDTNGNNVTLAGGLGGTGGLTKQGSGMLSLNGANTYTGPTTITGGTLAVNGSLASTVTIGSGGTIGGTGTIGGGLVSNGGTLAPGNSIGTLTVSGNFSQTGGVYQVEANAAGQSDRVNVGGTATVSGGATVAVQAQPGAYGRSTTYTILRANGGVSGTYSGVSSNFAFLTPSLSYDANDVFLTLTLNSFDFGARTFNQRAVGRVLDQTIGSANGDYATVLSAMVGLSTAQGPLALNAISGQNYAGFGNAMVQGAQLFLSNFANRAGSRSGGGTRVALAEACDVACDATSPALWGAWGGAVGGTGTIAGNDNAGTFTYSVGGFSGGLDRRFGDNFLAGVTVGYQTGGQWTGGFDGRSVTDSVQAGLYASFLQGPLYVDAVAAYAYSNNQLWRPINIPGLQPRTAYGQAGANQFLGQIEGGWRFDLGGAAGYFITPFALLQGSTATQNGLTETGAQSLNLSVAQQSTSSLRTIFGAQLGASMDLGLRDRIAAQLRLGWSHEYSDTARPVTASFAGAPSVPFTVFGAAPTRDGAVVGFSVSTAVAEAMGVYLRYEGNIAGQDSSHALTAGLRMSW